MELIKDCIIDSKRAETDAIDAEIASEFALAKEANGIRPQETPPL
jgi:hypothetical protein